MPYRDKEKRRTARRAYRKRPEARSAAAAYQRHWRTTEAGRRAAEQGRASARERARRYRRRQQPTAIPRERDYSGLPMDLRIVSTTWRPSDWAEDAAQDAVLAELEKKAAQRRAV